MRKPVIVAAAAMALCASMHGQTSGTFTIGPRYSNYATTIDANDIDRVPHPPRRPTT